MQHERRDGAAAFVELTVDLVPVSWNAEGAFG
jgi:hypothetical protein